MGSEQISACVNTKNGKMRVVDNSTMCKTKEYALVWNITGVQGSVGEQAIPGIKGDTGSKGEPGIIGSVGTEGKQGLQGEQGIAGISGLLSVYDGDGNLLGSLLGEFHESNSQSPIKGAPSGYSILSEEGFIYPLDTSTGTVYSGQLYNDEPSRYTGYALRGVSVIYYVIKIVWIKLM